MKMSLLVGALLLIVASHNSFARGDNRPSFTEIDSNGDGQISLEEFHALSQRKFSRIDINDDGFIQSEEMEAAQAMRRKWRK